MPASRFLQRKRAAARSSQRDWQERKNQDMLTRKAALCGELARIDDILERLRGRRAIGPDMSSDDLLELFREERDRLFEQLRDVDSALAGEAGEETIRQEAQVIALRRHAARSDTPT